MIIGLDGTRLTSLSRTAYPIPPAGVMLCGRGDRLLPEQWARHPSQIPESGQFAAVPGRIVPTVRAGCLVGTDPGRFVPKAARVGDRETVLYAWLRG